MWFKNLQLYRLPKNWNMLPAQLAELLASAQFTPCSSNQLESTGWTSPRANGGLVYSVGPQMLISLRSEKKLLPSSVIAQVAKARAKEMEEQQGFAPGKKAMKELKERVADELLPRAFSIQSETRAWIDPVNGWLAVDSSSASKADEVLKRLLKQIDKFPVESVRVQRSPVACMTAWLMEDEAPFSFTIDQDATLRATGESRAQVNYKKHSLEPEEMRRHISAGKQCTNIALTWDSKISFVLDESLCIKRLSPLDVLKENDVATRDSEERFESDMRLMTGELNLLINSVIDALGGFAEA